MEDKSTSASPGRKRMRFKKSRLLFAAVAIMVVYIMIEMHGRIGKSGIYALKEIFSLGQDFPEDFQKTIRQGMQLIRLKVTICNSSCSVHEHFHLCKTMKSYKSNHMSPFCSLKIKKYDQS